MSKSIESRISAIAAELKRRTEMQAEPMDTLSASLFNFQQELSALDDVGKIALLEALNRPGTDGTGGLALDMDALERMIEHEHFF